MMIHPATDFPVIICLSSNFYEGIEHDFVAFMRVQADVQSTEWLGLGKNTGNNDSSRRR